MTTLAAADAPAGPRLRDAARSFIGLLGQHRRAIARGLAFRAGESLFGVVPVVLVVLVIDRLRTNAVTPAFILLVALVLALALAGQLSCAYLANWTLWPACYRWGREMRQRALQHLRRLPMSFHSTRQSGDTATVLTRDLEVIEDFIGWLMPPLVGPVLVPISVIVSLAFVDLPLAVAMLISVVASVPVFGWTLRRYGDLGEQNKHMEAEVAARVVEHVQGITVIRAFGQRQGHQEQFHGALARLFGLNRRLIRAIAPVFAAFITVAQLGYAVVLLAGGYWLSGGRIDAGTLIVFLVLILRVFEPLQAMADRTQTLPMVAASVRRLTDLLNTAVPEEPTPASPPRSDDVAFDAVSFGYRAGTPVLQDVSFLVPAGTMTAVIGHSGAGKTTVLNLVAGLWDADRGSVRIGGVDVREMSSRQRQDLVTVVFQDVRLFSGTIHDNIALGRPDASADDVTAAARAAQCHDFITSLPAGYATVVGEGGSTMSGGERQRISIARAILTDAPVILLDEVTAAMDPTNAKLLQRALQELVIQRTLIVVAHRLSTIRSADQIVVLDRGRVTERGRHNELVTAGGTYARFWESREQAAGWRLTSAQVAANTASTTTGDPG